MDNLLSIFDSEKLDLEKFEKAFDIKLDGITFSMTDFQINHFVLNKQEFPTPFARFLQTRVEIYTRVTNLIDMYYQYRECLAKITLAEGKIQQLSSEPMDNVRWQQAQALKEIREAKIALHRLEIDKNKFRMEALRNQAIDKVREASVFYAAYKELRHFETDPPEKVREAEEEYWKIKSAYYPELVQRYGLTPGGFLKLPHEVGGLPLLKELSEKGQVKLPEQP